MYSIYVIMSRINFLKIFDRILAVLKNQTSSAPRSDQCYMYWLASGVTFVCILFSHENSSATKVQIQLTLFIGSATLHKLVMTVLQCHYEEKKTVAV